MMRAYMDNSTDGVTGVVPLPSADLIKYRFDHLDKTLEMLSGKMDLMSAAYVPRTEVDERLAALNNKINTLANNQTKLKETDDIQQGSVDANRRFTTIGLAVLSIVAVLLAAWISAKK